MCAGGSQTVHGRLQGRALLQLGAPGCAWRVQVSECFAVYVPLMKQDAESSGSIYSVTWPHGQAVLGKHPCTPCFSRE